MLRISEIWISHLKLRNPLQIRSMIQNLEVLPPISISESEDGTFQLEDGHHRLLSHWLSGKDYLDSHEYILILKNSWRPRKGKIEDVLNQLKKPA